MDNPTCDCAGCRHCRSVVGFLEQNVGSDGIGDAGPAVSYILRGIDTLADWLAANSPDSGGMVMAELVKGIAMIGHKVPGFGLQIDDKPYSHGGNPGTRQ